MIHINCIIFAEVDIISAAVVGLLAIAVLVFAILSAKTWHWINVVLLIFTMLASIASIVGMTQVFSYRREAMLDLAKATKDAEAKKLELTKIKIGNPLSPTYESGSLRSLSSEFTRTMIGRGRVFRGGTVGAGEGDQRTYTFPEDQTRNLQNEATLRGAVLFAFAETNGVAAHFVGALRVNAESETAFTLSPLELVDIQRYTEPSTTWALFEKMPQDEPMTFRNAIVAAIEANDSPTEPLTQLKDSLLGPAEDLDITAFRTALRESYLPAQQLGFQPDSLEYEALLDRFAFDGQPMGNIEKWIESAPNRKSTRFEPSPEELFVKVVFTEDAERTVRVDGVGVLENQGIYDANGRAIAPRLRQEGEGEIKFKKGDELFVDKQTWLGYRIDDTVVQSFQDKFSGQMNPQGEYFRRNLNDFPLMFRNLRLQTAATAKQIQKVATNNETTRSAFEDAGKQIRVRTDLIGQNEEDREQLQKDLAVIQQSNAQKKQMVATLQQKLQDLEADIESSYQQIQNKTLERLRTPVSVR